MKAPIPQSKRRVPNGKQIGLRSKPEKRTSWERLPFVGKDHSAHYSCWDVPLTGGYFGGIETGKVVARLYLKHLREEQNNPIGLGTTHLQGMLSSLNSKTPASAEEEASLKGQRVGFIYELGVWIQAAVTRLGSCLDAVPERTFVQHANESLTRTDAALMAAIAARSSQ
ncbi:MULTISPECIES: hypothetical protein [unclassified Pseudomonas]|uniref:hypothetical protein n=1 Tax=unclassified Pseudomonas TaxID=196821 RepID=UPI001CC13513|nr:MULTISPECIES: hypothetical protein [unclassified Pseudomonas]